MGIWDRFSTMFRSNLNDLISRAENPEKMLNQLIVDMKTQLGKAKQQVASAIADEKKLQADAEALRKQAEDWERRAMLAVQEGKDDLAKQALMRYNEALQGAQQLHDTWLKHRSETEKLKLSLRQLNDKIEEAKRKKNILLARAKRAEAQQRIQETMSGMSDKGAFESFERMAEKIEAQERKAIASAELQEEFEGDSLIKQFEVLEYHGTADQALLELKRKMGVLPPASGREGEAAGPGRRRARRRAGRRYRTGRRHHARIAGNRRPRSNTGEGSPIGSPFLLGITRSSSDILDPLAGHSRPHDPRPHDAMSQPRFLILADGDFGPMTSKTANSVIRYRPQQVVGVLDRQLAGRTSQDVLGFGGGDSGGRLDDGGPGPQADGDPHRHRALGRTAAGGVEGVAGRSARRRLRALERPSHLPGRRPGARRQGEGEGRRDPRCAASPREAARWQVDWPRTWTRTSCSRWAPTATSAR